MTRFYGRRVRVTLSKPRPAPQSKVGAFFGNLMPNGLEVENLRVRFEVKRSLSSTPNTAVIVITNLAPASRAFVAEQPLVVSLEAGYGDALRRLFVGDVTYAASKPVGPDIETTIQASEGGRAFLHARVNRAFAGGATAIQAIRDAAAAMGLSVSADVEKRADLQQQFQQGVTLAGRVSDELSRLLAPFGLGWSVQDGELQILDENTVLRPNQAILIDQGSGMIGSPDVAPPSKPGQKPTVTLSCLLLPEARPGTKVKIVSRTVTGFHRIKEAAHKGDTHGSGADSWTTAMEVTEAPGR